MMKAVIADDRVGAKECKLVRIGHKFQIGDDFAWDYSLYELQIVHRDKAVGLAIIRPDEFFILRDSGDGDYFVVGITVLESKAYLTVYGIRLFYKEQHERRFKVTWYKKPHKIEIEELVEWCRDDNRLVVNMEQVYECPIDNE